MSVVTVSFVLVLSVCFVVWSYRSAIVNTFANANAKSDTRENSFQNKIILRQKKEKDTDIISNHSE